MSIADLPEFPLVCTCLDEASNPLIVVELAAFRIVAINGEAKAYAIGPLNGREMVNDTVGGTPVLVTW